MGGSATITAMGGKFAGRASGGTIDGVELTSFLEGLPPAHRSNFDVLRTLIYEVAPAAEEGLKWGTMSFDLHGSLFALSANKKQLNLYVLTIGLLAKHQDLIGDIPQGKCVLRFAPEAELPLAALRTVMRAAVATK